MNKNSFLHFRPWPGLNQCGLILLVRRLLMLSNGSCLPRGRGERQFAANSGLVQAGRPNDRTEAALPYAEIDHECRLGPMRALRGSASAALGLANA